MNIAVVDVVWDWHPRQYSAQQGFYGDVDHCVADVRRRWPQAFADCETDTPSVKHRWVQDNRFYRQNREVAMAGYGRLWKIKPDAYAPPKRNGVFAEMDRLRNG